MGDRDVNSDCGRMDSPGASGRRLMPYNMDFSPTTIQQELDAGGVRKIDKPVGGPMADGQWLSGNATD